MDATFPAEVLEGVFVRRFIPPAPVLGEPVDITFASQPRFGVVDDLVVTGSIGLGENLRCRPEFPGVLVDEHAECVTSFEGRIFHGVEAEIARRATVAADGSAVVWVADNELEHPSRPDEAWFAVHG